MNHRTLAFLAVSLFASSSIVGAHDRDDKYYSQNNRYERDDQDDRYEARYDQRYDKHYDKHNDARYGRYDYARVIRVERIGGYAHDYRQQCYDNRSSYDNQSSINNGAVIGTIAGGVIGNQVGKGDGRTVSTVAGALIGGLIGQSVDRNNRGGYDRHYVECRSDYGYNNRGGNLDYRVTYRYRDRVYSTIMPYNPGNSVRVRIDTRPTYNRNYAYRY